MNTNFQISSTALNQVYNFAKMYERLHMIPADSPWLEKLVDVCKRKSALAAVTFQKSDLDDKTLFFNEKNVKSRLNDEAQKDYDHYLKTLMDIPNIFAHGDQFSIEVLEKIHRGVVGAKERSHKYAFRKTVRMLPKYVIENNVYKTINLEVVMQPGEIMQNITDFINWLNTDSRSINALFVAAIGHLKIAQIHPYDDGNGRLARVFENGVFFVNGYDFYPLVSLEEYYLNKLENYYDVIEESIIKNDMTKWFEFYTEGLLSAVTVTFDIIHKLSGGTIDLHQRKVIPLTEKEIEVIDILNENTQASGAEIAKKLNVTRQNINVILKRLENKVVVEKIGKGTSSRYKLKNTK